MKSLISTLAFGLLFLNPANAKYNRYVGNDCERSSEGMTSCELDAWGHLKRVKSCYLGKWQYKKCKTECVKINWQWECPDEEPAVWDTPHGGTDHPNYGHPDNPNGFDDAWPNNYWPGHDPKDGRPTATGPMWPGFTSRRQHMDDQVKTLTK